MNTVKYDNDFLELLNLKKNKKFKELFIKKKLVYLLYQNNDSVNENFLNKIEVLIKKRKNYERKLGFNLLDNNNDINNYYSIPIENHVNIYQDIAGNIINIDMNNYSNNTCAIDTSNNTCAINIEELDISNNTCSITNSINDGLSKFQQMINNVEKLVKFFEDTNDKFYAINNKGNTIKTMVL